MLIYKQHFIKNLRRLAADNDCVHVSGVCLQAKQDGDNVQLLRAFGQLN